MAEVGIADFLVRFPVFDGVPHSQVSAQLDDANLTFAPDSFPNEVSFRRAIMLFTAHNLVLMGVGQTAEANIISQGFALDSVQSVSDSGVSVSLRDSSKDSRSAYGSTSYGRELAKLLRVSSISGTIGGDRSPRNA